MLNSLCISADTFELTFLLRLDLDWRGARGNGGDEVTPEGLNSSSSSSIPPTLPSGELRFLFGEGPIDEEEKRFRALRSSAFFLRNSDAFLVCSALFATMRSTAACALLWFASIIDCGGEGFKGDGDFRVASFVSSETALE
mmetsp:Transcript_24810/g.49374  ORF Transcript_24810/g.49374 Transcript_24810/m.49374 type:complete len:141 (+) Transcript_24810:164-586(+)